MKKILLVQLFSNGDCLFATTIARQIKNDFPGCVLTWAIAGFCKNILDENPYVDYVLVIDEVKKNDVNAFRRYKRKLYKEKEAGIWDEVFITHNMDNNQALYDGTIRGMIFRAYPKPVTVPVQPVLVINEIEKQRVADFAVKYKLPSFSNVILWEYAPQSGQSVLTKEFVMQVANKIVATPGTCIILSSANTFQSTTNIIDASVLSVRENAALTHYCDLLIGCSSGITWLSTSSAAKQLPMIQLLNPYTAFLNAPSVDFERYGLPTEQLIEITTINEENLLGCLELVRNEGFGVAKKKFNQALPLQFNTTRKIVYNMLCYLQFGAIARHYHIITSLYGKQPAFLKQFWLAIIGFPFKLIGNFFRKRITGSK